MTKTISKLIKIQIAFEMNEDWKVGSKVGDSKYFFIVDMRDKFFSFGAKGTFYYS